MDLLGEMREKRERTRALLGQALALEDSPTRDGLVERLEDALVRVDREVRDIERSIVRIEAPELSWRMRRVERELQTCQLAVQVGVRRSRHRCGPRPRGRRATCRARSPGRLADDDPLDPPARVLYQHAATSGHPQVAAWLESWGDAVIAGTA